jgi:TolA-binding protein
MTREEGLFQEGVRLTSQGFYMDAIDQFRKLIAERPDGDLADDASYNIGLCYFQVNQFELALEEFHRTIAQYPDATIDPGKLQQEKGKTAAKAYLGCISCLLGLGRLEEAKEALARLKAYPESGVLSQDGSFRAFHVLGEELIAKFERHQVLEISEESGNE